MDEPVKCLGRVYSAELKDRARVDEVKKMLIDGLDVIGKSEVQGTIECWMYQFGLLPRIMWPLMMYKLPLTAVEEFERRSTGCIKKWLCAPKSLTSLALYSKDTVLQLPIKSLLDEFKLSKCRNVSGFQESKDPVVYSVQPEVVTGRKWKASEEVRDAERDLFTECIVGVVQCGRAGLGYNVRI